MACGLLTAMMMNDDDDGERMLLFEREIRRKRGAPRAEEESWNVTSSSATSDSYARTLYIPLHCWFPVVVYKTTSTNLVYHSDYFD